MESTENEKPPVFRKWSSWYWLVMIVMIIQVIIYSLITFSFS
ncbi:hypothetical protein BH10BAC4_BH10BAC4_24320 [soil metagenome]